MKCLRWFQIGLFLILGLSFGFNPRYTYAQSSESTDEPIDILLLIDSSTGLQETDPNNTRNLVALEIARLLEIDALWNGFDDRVGLMFFAHTTQHNVMVVTASSDLIRSGLVQTMTLEPGTDFTAVFSSAVEDSGITSPSGTQRQRVVILLTDGEPDFPLSDADQAAGLTPVRKFFDSNPLQPLTAQELQFHLVLVEGAQPSVVTEWGRIVPTEQLIKLNPTSNPTAIAETILTSIDERFNAIIAPPSREQAFSEALPSIGVVTGVIIGASGIAMSFVHFRNRGHLNKEKQQHNEEKQKFEKQIPKLNEKYRENIRVAGIAIHNALRQQNTRLREIDKEKDGMEKALDEKREEIKKEEDRMEKALNEKQKETNKALIAIADKVEQKWSQASIARELADDELTKQMAETSKQKQLTEEMESKQIELQKLIDDNKATEKNMEDQKSTIEEQKQEAKIAGARVIGIGGEYKKLEELRKNSRQNREEINKLYRTIEDKLCENFGTLSASRQLQHQWLSKILQERLDFVLDGKHKNSYEDILRDKLAYYQDKPETHDQVAKAMLNRWFENPELLGKEFSVCASFQWLIESLFNRELPLRKIEGR